MRSYLSLGTGIISLQMSAVSPRRWDLLQISMSYLVGLKEEKKRKSQTERFDKNLFLSVCGDNKELPHICNVLSQLHTSLG